MTKKKKVAVYLYNLSNRYVGLGEFAHNLALRMSAKAAELKTQQNLEFCFLVPKGMSGDYGDEVDYLVLRKWRYILLNARSHHHLSACIGDHSRCQLLPQ